MSFATELTKIRRFLRDPSGSIWSDAFIRHVYNDVQQDFQHKTKFLMDVAVQRVPGVYEFAYQKDWEFNYITETRTYQCLFRHDEKVVTNRWEMQQIAGIAADVADYGTSFTHPWEAYMCSPNDVIKMRFPNNFNSMRFIAYDEEPISAMSQKQVQNDPSNVTNTGRPIGYYCFDQVDNEYVLYPRPSAGFADELDDEVGSVFFASDDTEDGTAGVIGVRSNTDDLDYGIPVDLIGTVDNVFMVYECKPTDMLAGTDEQDFPDFILKYVRFGVIGRCYGGNNDGRIRSLADYWNGRYMLGIQLVKKYLLLKKQDRNYRFKTADVNPFRASRHARLPDSYPAVNP